MNKEQIIEKTVVAICHEFEKEAGEIQPSAKIKELLDLDSLGLVDMVALLEEEFSIEIEGREAFRLRTFSELYDLLETKVVS